MLDCVTASGSDQGEFEKIMQHLDDSKVRDHRNTLAHSDSAAKELAATVHTAIIGERQQPGMLAWIVEHLEPLLQGAEQNHD